MTRSCVALAWMMTLLAAGCQTMGTATTGSLDDERAALARFIGPWDFEGWYEPDDGPRRRAAGIAAGVIEHDWFVQLDSQRIVEQAGEVEYLTGSMLLSAEPGVGVMLTAWSEESPSVHRFRGRVDGEALIFDEFETPPGRDHLWMEIRFETPDRWIARIDRDSPQGNIRAAEYTFTRVP